MENQDAFNAWYDNEVYSERNPGGCPGMCYTVRSIWPEHINALEPIVRQSGVIITPDCVAEWISVKDRLPENDPTIEKHIEGESFGFLTVLVYNGVVKQANRFFCDAPKFGLPKTDGWEWASSNVTHWIPLPEPPKDA